MAVSWVNYSNYKSNLTLNIFPFFPRAYNVFCWWSRFSLGKDDVPVSWRTMGRHTLISIFQNERNILPGMGMGNPFFSHPENGENAQGGWVLWGYNRK